MLQLKNTNKPCHLKIVIKKLKIEVYYNVWHVFQTNKELFNEKYEQIIVKFLCGIVSDCCLMPNERKFSAISCWEHVTLDEMIVCFVLDQHLYCILIVLFRWNNMYSPRIDILFHLDTLSLFWANIFCSFSLMLHA